MKLRALPQFARFASVGATNAGIDVVVFNAAVFAHPTRSPQVLVGYNTLAVLAALANSYWWNSRWTFGDHAARARPQRWRQRGLFLVQAAVNLLVNDLCVWLLGTLLRPGTGLPTPLASNLAKVTAMVTSSAVSYLLMAVVVFPGPRRRQRPATGTARNKIRLGARRRPGPSSSPPGPTPDQTGNDHH